MNFFKQHVKPVLVLLAICLVVSAALAFTYSATSKVIEKKAQEQALATRMEILPNATGFSQLECSVEHVVSVFADDGGSGYIVTVISKGYGGAVEFTVGLTPDGEVIKLRVNDHSETTGVGTRALADDYLSRFEGSVLPDDIDVLAGATYSSRAVQNAVRTALSAYEAVKEAGK